MHSFRYVQNRLHCESTDLETLAEKHGTPLYVYSKETISDHFTRLDESLEKLDHLICYAVKANSNLAILHTIAELGGGFDIVSGGELFRVLKAGGKANMHLCGRREDARRNRVCPREGIYSFNAESEAELRHINEIAGAMGKKAPVALRVNPNVDAKTHAYISTGKRKTSSASSSTASGCLRQGGQGLPASGNPRRADAHRIPAHGHRAFHRGGQEVVASRAGAQGAPPPEFSPSAAASALCTAKVSTAATPPGGVTSPRQRPLSIRPTPMPWCRSLSLSACASCWSPAATWSAMPGPC